MAGCFYEEKRKIGGRQSAFAICKSGEGSELKPNSYGEADFARVACDWLQWLVVCVALAAPFCCSFLLPLFVAGVCAHRAETMNGGGPRLSFFGQVSASMGQWRARGAQCQLRSCTALSGAREEVPGRTSLAAVQTSPSGCARWPRHHPVTTHSQSPPGCMHGLAYYCVPWPAIPGSLPFCFSKATTRQPLHHLTLHQESHLLSQKIIAAALPFCQTPLLPDKPLLRPKADHQKLPFASDISECDSGFPSRRAVCGRPICPATPKTARRKTTEKAIEPWLSREAPAAARAHPRAAPCMPREEEALTHGCAALQIRLEASRHREPSTWQLWHLLSAISP